MIFNPLFISNSNSVNSFGSSKFGNPGYLFSDIINVNETKSNQVSESISAKFSSFLLGQADIPSDSVENNSKVSQAEKVFANGYRLNKEAVDNFIENLIHSANSLQIDSQKIEIIDPKQASEKVFELLEGKLSKSHPVELNVINNTSSLSLEIQNYDAVLKTADISGSSPASVEMSSKVYKSELNKLATFLNNFNAINDNQIKMPFQLKVELGELFDKLNPTVNKNEKVFANQNQLVEQLEAIVISNSASIDSLSSNDKLLINNFIEFLQKSNISEKLDGFNKNFSKVLINNVEQKVDEKKIDSELDNHDTLNLAGLFSSFTEKEISDLIGFFKANNEVVSASEIKMISDFANSELHVENIKLEELLTNLSSDQKEVIFSAIEKIISPIPKLTNDEAKSFLAMDPTLLSKVLPEAKELTNLLGSEWNLKELFNNPQIAGLVKSRLQTFLSIDISSDLRSVKDVKVETQFSNGIIDNANYSLLNNQDYNEIKQNSNTNTNTNSNDIKSNLTLSSIRTDLSNALKTEDKQFVSAIKELVTKISNAPLDMQQQVINNDQLKPMMNAVIAKLKMIDQPTEQLKDQLQKLVTMPTLSKVADKSSYTKIADVDENIKHAQKKNNTSLNSEKLLKLTSVSHNQKNEFVLKVLSQKELVSDDQNQLKNLITKQSDSHISKLSNNLSDLVRKELMMNDEINISQKENSNPKSSLKVLDSSESALKAFGSKEIEQTYSHAKLALGKTIDKAVSPELTAKFNLSAKVADQNSHKLSELAIQQNNVNDNEVSSKSHVNIAVKNSTPFELSDIRAKGSSETINSNKIVTPEKVMELKSSEVVEKIGQQSKNISEIKINTSLNSTDSQNLSNVAKDFPSNLSTKFAWSDTKLNLNNYAELDESKPYIKLQTKNSKNEVLKEAPNTNEFQFSHKPNINDNKPKLAWVDEHSVGKNELMKNHKVIENEIPKIVDVSRNTSSEIKATEQKVEMDSKPVTATNSESKTSDFNMNNNSQNNNSGLSDGKYSGEYHVKNDSSINPSFDKALNNEQQLRSNINQRVEIIKDVQLNSVNSRIESLIASRESQSLTLKLNPASLGKIDIALEVIENTVKANIEVENEVVRQSVQANIDQLRQSLIQQGLQPQSLSVSLSNSEDRSNKYFKNKKRNQHDREVELENSLEQEAPKKMGYNTYDFVA